MSKQINPGIKLGILGGGQLARMLALSAHQMGIYPHVLSENSLDPAQQVTRFNHVGSLSDSKVFEDFLKQVDICTFESEFLDGTLLNQTHQTTKTPIYPNVSTMELLQDRLTQKQNLDLLKIPTAPWLPANSPAEAEKAVATLGLPVVFKKRRFGYDGYGTFVVKTNLQLEEFCAKQFPSTTGFIVEKWIPFKRELACVFARNISGEVSHYPLVESLQKNSRCFWVKGPVKHKNFSAFVKKFTLFLKKMNYVGVMAVEFFDSQKGLLVNELAPRVHNSAHCTMTAFSVSQFDLHIKALLNQSVNIPKANAKGFAMVNLLGGSKAKTAIQIQWKMNPDVQLHWYGKTENREGRKMGHLNALGNSPEAALQLALKSLKRIQL